MKTNNRFTNLFTNKNSTSSQFKVWNKVIPKVQESVSSSDTPSCLEETIDSSISFLI